MLSAVQQDLTQETFIRAFRRLSRFRGDASLNTWLYSVAINVCLNGMRAAGVQSAAATHRGDDTS
ncbi:MAG: polymerase sigma factor, sigma-70 family [Gemmatimonadetes bacterium]|nr:polymerase sigma factor, sigma-70 family [Gemmatimonadota bacterium]